MKKAAQFRERPEAVPENRIWPLCSFITWIRSRAVDGNDEGARDERPDCEWAHRSH